MNRIRLTVIIAAVLYATGLQAGTLVDSTAKTHTEVFQEVSDVETTAPQIKVSIEEASCNAFHYDRCSFLEPSCDGNEYSDGELLVKDDGSKTYKMRVQAQNVYAVWDSCGLFKEFPSQVAEHGGDLDQVVEWGWNGAFAYPRDENGVSDHRQTPEQHWERADNDPWYDHISGGVTLKAYFLRLPGASNCTVYALGENWQVQEVSFTYSCTEGGGSASPR